VFNVSAVLVSLD